MCDVTSISYRTSLPATLSIVFQASFVTVLVFQSLVDIDTRVHRIQDNKAGNNLFDCARYTIAKTD